MGDFANACEHMLDKRKRRISQVPSRLRPIIISMRIDPLVANPGRLCILAALASDPRQPFVQLRNQTGLTDGNLATHARRLHSAGLIAIEKSITRGKPLTTLHLTPQGRAALSSHVQSLTQALQPQPAEISAVTAEDDWVD